MNAHELLRHFERVADAPDALGRLRWLIFELAIHGKLTEFGRRATAVHSLGKLAEFIMGQAPPGSSCNESGDGTVFVKVGEFGERFPRRVVWTTEPLKFARQGDVLICVVGATIGKLNLAIDCAIGRSVAAIRPNDELDQVFLYYSLMPVVMRLREDSRGSAQGVISRADLAAISVWLPPIAEQRRIVAKVDELMALCDRLEAARAEREAARDRLTAASLARLATADSSSLADDARFVVDAMPSLLTRPQQVMQLRQALLHLAVRGRLVAQDPSDESASALLARISSMRAARAPSGKARSRTALPPIDAEQAPFELPPGWAWARFPELGVFGRGKSKHRPRNDPALFVDGQHLVIQTGDVARSGGLIRTHTSKYNDVGLAQSHKWPAGTLCITIAANIADSGLLTFDACFPDSVVGFVPDPILGNAQYFEYFVRTAKANLLEFAPATAQKNINLEILESVLIPLPPLKEQQRIVARVDELMALCDQLVDSLHGQEVGATRLLETLVAQAVKQSEATEASA